MVDQYILQAQALREAPILCDNKPFGVAAFNGDVFTNPLCIKVRNLVDRFLPETTLEIGSGGGRWSRYLHSRCKQLVCVDYNDATVDHICALKLHPTPGFMICRDGVFPSCVQADLVFSFDTFVHFPPALFWKYIETLPKANLILHHGVGKQINDDWFTYTATKVDAAVGRRLVAEVYSDPTNTLQGRVACYEA